MKTIKVISAVFLMTLFLSANSKAENKNAADKNYTIEAASSSSSSSSNYIETGNAYKIYFETLDSPMEVTVNEHSEGTDFIVKNNDFEVMYCLRGNVFGVSYLQEEYATVEKEKMYKKIDRKSFLHQKVITQNKKSEKEYIQLIASYVPELMK